VGGTGRGAGWAGNIELVVGTEPALQRALRGTVVRWSGDEPVTVLGPYHATSAALVAVDHDVVVLFGSATGTVSADEAALRRAAAVAVEHVGAVTPAKRLADELEALAAVRSTMQCTDEALDDVLRHVTRSAAEALGCEIGLTWLPEQDRLVAVERGWVLDATEDALLAALQAVAALELPVCEQDSTRAPLPDPLGPSAGVRSHFVLPLGAPARGVLVLLHTVVTPRGFTALCQDVGQKVAEAAGVVVHGAVLREELVRLVAAAEAAARRDPLTGLANRLRWQEELDRLGEDVAVGSPAAVLVVDLNGLKTMNDAFGHDAGDDYLRAAADALRGAARDEDVVARLGGDEFGVLVHGAGPEQAERLVQRVRQALATAPRVHGVPVSAAIGSATCPPLRSVRAAFAEADRAMYVDKTARRSA
jgi:diguanylate cyclase (GGDEF)-like protein